MASQIKDPAPAPAANANAAALAQAREQAVAEASAREAAIKLAAEQEKARAELLREYNEGTNHEQRYVPHPDLRDRFAVPQIGEYANVGRGRRNRPKDKSPVFYVTNGNQQKDFEVSAVGAMISSGLVTIPEIVNQWSREQRKLAAELISKLV